MADWGIKISKAGFDVKTCTDLESSFKPTFDLLKVVASGTGTIPAGNVATITHSLGYIPQFLVFGVKTGFYAAEDSSILGTGDYLYQFIVGSSTTTLTIFGTVGQDYVYYIFYESIDGSSNSNTVSSNDYGLKVMKAGKAITSTNIEDQAFNSEKNCLKIAKQGVYSTTSASSGVNEITIAHGLSYTPGIITWVEVNGDGKHYSGSSSGNVTRIEVDATNLYFTYFDIPSSQSIKFYYVLFVENSV